MQKKKLVADVKCIVISNRPNLNALISELSLEHWSF